MRAVLPLPDVELDEAQTAAARLHDTVRAGPFAFPHGQHIAVTANVGGSRTSGRGGLDAFLPRVDAELYTVKNAGRDGSRVTVGGRLPEASADVTISRAPPGQHGMVIA